MKNLIICGFVAIFLMNCASESSNSDPIPVTQNPTKPISDIDSTTILKTVKGEWMINDGGAGGTGSGINLESFKNFQYNFEVKINNQKVDIGLISSEIDVQFALFNALGERVDISSLARSTSKTYTLNSGKYRVVVCATRNAVGKFELSMKGVVAGPSLISSKILKSNTQTWGTLGGGGSEQSFKNHFYTFDITENNSSIDVELESPDTEVLLAVYDELNTLIKTERYGRREFLIKLANKGTYRIMAATNKRGSLGNYNIIVNGKVDNLKRIQSQLLQSETQNWGEFGGGGAEKTFKNHFYTFDVTENNTNVDLDLESPDTEIVLTLYDQVGALIRTERANRKEYMIRLLNKGTYTVMVGTNLRSSKGSYRLNINGLVGNLKRVPSKTETNTGTWKNGNDEVYYEFEITENNSVFDMELSSSEVNVRLRLATGNGDNIVTQSSNRTEFIVRSLAKGVYRVYLRPSSTSGPGGNYKLTVHGQFK